MKESSYQSKIIKAIEAKGGWVVNGQFSKAGELDLQCGYPIVFAEHQANTTISSKNTLILAYIAVEVKTEEDYHRVMNCVDEVNSKYVINGNKGLKKHEPLQVAKANMIRERGGLAIFAYCIEQVEEYVKCQTNQN